MIGPFGLARFVEDQPWLAYAVITNTDRVHALAELGVVFLLFMIGLELFVDRLWAMRRSVFGLGAGSSVTRSGAAIACFPDNTGGQLISFNAACREERVSNQAAARLSRLSH